MQRLAVVALFAVLAIMPAASAGPVVPKPTAEETRAAQAVADLVQRMMSQTERATRAAVEAQAEVQRLEQENATLRAKLACS